MLASLAAATPAAARTLTVNTTARVGVISTGAQQLELAGSMRDPRLGRGGVLLDVSAQAGGYAGTLKLVTGEGRLEVRLTTTAGARPGGQLLDLKGSGRVVRATGRYRGARGRLRGTAVLTADRGIGDLKVRGRLTGAEGSAPSPTPGSRRRAVDVKVRGTQVLLRGGQELLAASTTGLTDEEGIVVLEVDQQATEVDADFVVYNGRGTFRGRITFTRSDDLGSGVRRDRGTVVITSGTGAYAGARTLGRGDVTGTRNLASQLFTLDVGGRIAW